MATIVDILIAELDLDHKKYDEGLEKAGEKGKETFSELAKGALEFFGIMASAAGIYKFIESTNAAALSAKRLADEAHTSMEEIEAFRGVIKDAGGTSEEADAAIKGVGEAIAVVGTKLRGAKQAEIALAALGISKSQIKQEDPTEQLSTIAAGLKNLHDKGQDFKAIKLGATFGLSEAVVRSLQEGGEATKKAIEEQLKLGVAHEQDAENAEKLEKGMNHLKTTITAAALPIVEVMVPALTAVANGLIKVVQWIEGHKSIVIDALLAIATTFTVIGINALIASAATWSLAGALAAIGGPITLIVIGVAALGAAIGWAYEKWKEWMSGSKTSLDSFFNFFKVIWDNIKTVVMDVFVTLKDIVMTYLDTWKQAWNLLVAIFTGNGDKIKEAWSKLCGDINRILSEALVLLIYGILIFYFRAQKIFKDIWSSFKTSAEAPFMWVENKLKNIGNMLKDYYSIFGKLLTGDFKGSIQSGIKVIGDIKNITGSGVNAGQALSPSISNKAVNNTSHKEVNIQQLNVNAPQATDASGIANGMHGAIQNHSLVDQSDGGLF